MKIAFISYATNQGISVISHTIAQNVNSTNYLMVDYSPRVVNDVWATWCWGKTENPPSATVLSDFFDNVSPDIFFAVETPFSVETFKIAHSYGVKTILIPMIERFNRKSPFWQGVIKNTNLIICPTKQSYDWFSKIESDICAYAQYPIDIHDFEFKRRTICRNFLHNAGFGGVNFRKGTNEVVRAFYKTAIDAKLIINSQIPQGQFPEVSELIDHDSRIKFRITNTSDKNVLYEDGDVAIQPSKFEGVGLTIPESMACGLPTITTNYPPMNEYVDDPDMLVEVDKEFVTPSPNKEIKGAIVSEKSLIKKMASVFNQNISKKSLEARRRIERKFSWDVLGDTWRGLMKGLHKGK